MAYSCEINLVVLWNWLKDCKLANRVSSNIELPSDKSLKLLAPNKTKEKVLQPLKFARDFLKKQNQ